MASLAKKLDFYPDLFSQEPTPIVEVAPEPIVELEPALPVIEAIPTEAQVSLFSVDEAPPGWADHWKSMPEFEQKDLEPWQSIYVHFRGLEDRRAFSEFIGQKIGDKTRSIWYPKLEFDHYISTRRYVAASDPIDPRYPIYIISKGRWESRQTARHLERMGVAYSIVVEPQEQAQYAAVIDQARILVTPFSNLGQGSIPVRNFVWEHALKSGAKRHWILDDNINGFYRLCDNAKVPVTTGATFRAAEDFVDRYENVAIAGFQYFMFAPRKTVIPPFALNTRIYSCILIDNSIPYRWRGRYNEDTDLSIRALKDGWCTVLFYAFLADKSTTMTMKGGNTDELYQDDGRLKMAESLRDQYPDIVRITRKWGRWQHHVDYSGFRRNKLIPVAGLTIDKTSNNYGMELKILTDAAQVVEIDQDSAAPIDEDEDDSSLGKIE